MATSTSQRKILTPQQRRAACNPLLIGAITGFLAPGLAVIWAVRQRSLPLAVGALAPIVIWAFGPAESFQGDERQASKYGHQALSGLIAFAISHQQKVNAKKELDPS